MEVRVIGRGDAIVATFPRPATVIERRFAQGARCYGAFDGQHLLAFISPMRGFVQGAWGLSRLQHPANGRNRRPFGRPRFFSRLPVRQRTLPVPKRLRYYRQHDPALETLAQRIFLSVVERVFL